MRTSWQLMKWRGVPVVLSWTVLLALPWFYYRQGTLLGMTVAFVAFFFLLFVHELGHAAVAKWRRVPVLGINLYIMHGLCWYEEPEKKSDEIWIAWGGVASQAALLMLALGASYLLERYAFLLFVHASPALHIFIVTNLFLMLFNLIPLPPLDGAKAWLVVPMLWKRVPKPSLKRWRRNRELKRRSEVATADIIERLKKKQ
jgi:stage IV sporulation protein FB